MTGAARMAAADGILDPRRLPANLLDATRALRADSVLAEALGENFVRASTRFKQAEWNERNAQISEWERASTLGC